MKTINLETDAAQFHDYFDMLKLEQKNVLIWQLDKITNKRIIFQSFVASVDQAQTHISCNSQNDITYDFNPGDLFLYVEDSMSICKVEQISIQNNYLSIKYPEELKFLDEMEDDKIKAVFEAINPGFVKEAPKFHSLSESDDKEKGYEFISENAPEKEAPEWEETTGISRRERLNSMWEGALNEHDQALFAEELSFITLDEEDLLHEGDRSTPRARPPEGKLVTIQIKDESRPQETLPLHDLSQGGIGFLVFDQSAYESGEVIHIKGFDTKKFDSPMLAVVRSIREADDMGIQFKVGLQFITDEAQA
jgi:hypothetical protein